jgi:hypothetical protein
MRTIQKELIGKGLKKEEEKKPRDEFIQGEIASTMMQSTYEHATYRKPSERFDANKMRHGRTVRIGVEKMDTEKEKQSTAFKVIDYLMRFKEVPLTTPDIVEGLRAQEPKESFNQGSISAILASMKQFKMINAVSVAGARGFGYQLASTYGNNSVDEVNTIYKYEAARIRRNQKQKKVGTGKGERKVKAPTGTANAVTASLEHIKQDAVNTFKHGIERAMNCFNTDLKIPSNIEIHISGSVEVIFKLG